MTKNRPALESNERFLKVVINIPDKAFDIPDFSANIDIPENKIDIINQLEVELKRIKET